MLLTSDAPTSREARRVSRVDSYQPSDYARKRATTNRPEVTTMTSQYDPHNYRVLAGYAAEQERLSVGGAGHGGQPARSQRVTPPRERLLNALADVEGLHETPMCEVCLTGIARAGHVTCLDCAGQE